MMEIFKDGVKVTSGTAIDINESTGIDIAATGDGHVGDLTISLEETTIRYAEIALTNVNIKALRATPITLVAAPGATKTIEFVSAVLKLNAGSEVLTESADNLAVRYTNGTGALLSQAIEATGFIDQAADTITNALPKIDAIVAVTASANQAIVVHNTGDGEYAGNASNDATVVIGIAYRVHTL